LVRQLLKERSNRTHVAVVADRQYKYVQLQQHSGRVLRGPTSCLGQHYVRLNTSTIAGTTPSSTRPSRLNIHCFANITYMLKCTILY